MDNGGVRIAIETDERGGIIPGACGSVCRVVSRRFPAQLKRGLMYNIYVENNLRSHSHTLKRGGGG